jgi:hypothetical protein
MSEGQRIKGRSLAGVWIETEPLPDLDGPPLGRSLAGVRRVLRPFIGLSPTRDLRTPRFQSAALNPRDHSNANRFFIGLAQADPLHYDGNLI